MSVVVFCVKIWNHPDVLFETLQKENLTNEQDLDLDDLASNPRGPPAGLKAKANANAALPPINPSQERANQVITYEWVLHHHRLSVHRLENGSAF